MGTLRWENGRNILRERWGGVDNRVVWGEKEDERAGEEEKLSREEIKM